MKIAKLAGLLGCVWALGTGCGTPSSWQPPDSTEVISETDLPEAVAFAVDAIQPGGTTVSVERVWRDDRASFLVTKSYQQEGVARQRSVWLADDGKVIERTHEIAVDQAAGAAREAVAALGAGDVLKVEVVQRGPGEERYRFRLAEPGKDWSVVECSLAGTNVRRLCWRR